MRRTATLSLEGFDPDVIEAAREVAERAGVPLEAWIASVVGPETAPVRAPAPRQKSRPVSKTPAQKAAPRSAPDPALPTAPASTGPEPAGASITAMMRRLDALDRSLNEDRDALRAEAARAAEARTASLGQNSIQVGQVTERLAEIERRMGDLNSQFSGPRPLGRRGRPLVAEMREAVEEVRRRQRELDASGPAAEANGPSPAIAELQAETSRLRESLGGLATGRDVSALEQAMRSLSTDVQRAREPAEFAAPIETMRRQVEHLAEEFADNVHARLVGEVERLANQANGTLGDALASHADQNALDGVHHELDEIRQMIAGLAGPERIQSLAQSLQAISSQIAKLQVGAGSAGIAELKPLLEEIRNGIASPGDTRVLLGRIEALAETMQRPAAPGDDLASMHALLRGVAEKVERVGSGAGNLDALENQVVTLARRLETGTASPSVAGLERTMSELLTQIVSLRDETSVEAAVERATRKAIADTIGAAGHVPGLGKIDAFRADLDDLRARQVSADRRMQATLDGLNTVLSRLVDRLGVPDAAGLRASGPESAPSLSEQLLTSTTVGTSKSETMPVSAPRSRAARRPEPAHDAFGHGDELLEPGAGRPAPVPLQAPRSTPAEKAETASTGDIKTNFIAAARRAAQAAQADIAAEAPAAPDRRDSVRPRLSPPAPVTQGLVGRLLGGIEKRRRPLLLGLAAVVLVLGALQAYEMNFGAREAGQPATPVAAAKPTVNETPVAEAREAVLSATAPAPAGPQTTQSIADAASANTKLPTPPRTQESASPMPVAPIQVAIPHVATMASLSRDLSTVPAGLASLKQAALDGDGAAIYELAAREADGRGMPRDLALAAKLYEQLADAGYAPAQFKLGSFYEKGSGVIRDLGQAKTWYDRAAERGNTRAMHNLAVLNAENPSASGKPDFATAASWFRRAAEYGVRDSQYNLAVLYARGLGLGQDLIQSYAWFSAAAAQGDEEAGKKRDDVAAKLSAKDLAAAKGVVSAYKPKTADPSANDLPPVKAAPPAAMSLLGAAPPGSPSAASFTPSPPRTGV